LAYLLKDRGPIEALKPIGKCLGFGHVVDPEKNVVVFGKADVIGRELSREPLMPIEIHLDLHGKPGLNPHKDQAEVAIHAVRI
jgi:hypothetical protein